MAEQRQQLRGSVTRGSAIDAMRGIALVGVLWVVALVVLIASTLSGIVRSDMNLARNLIEEAAVRYAVDGAIQLAAYRTLHTNQKGAWLADGSLNRIMVGEVPVQVAISDETGKLDINAVPTELLVNLITNTGTELEHATALVDAMADYRDDDHLRRANGAEDPDYLALDKSYGAKDAYFETLEELLLVLGMDSQLYKQIKDALTVYPRHAGFNAAVASHQVLLTVPEVSSEWAESYIDLRRQRHKKGLPPPVASAVPARYVSSARAQYFTVSAEARIGTAAGVRVESVIMLTPAQAKRPFRVVRWKYTEPRGDKDLVGADSAGDHGAAL